MTELVQSMSELPDVTLREAVAHLAENDPYVWTVRNRILRGKPLKFDVLNEINAAGNKPSKSLLLRHRPFLIQPLRDKHPHKVYKKARQVGVSELSITECIQFLATHPGSKHIYTFPRDVQLRDFSMTRISEAFAESPMMLRLLGVPNQIYTKRIGDAFMILRSAWESNLGEGIDADGVTLDEKDRMKPGIDIAFRESLQSSKYGLFREVSTPTLPGRGVDETFQKSCQYEWFMRCTKCGLKQPILYPDNIIQVKDVPVGTKQLEAGSYLYQCKRSDCRGAIDRLHGEWVSKFPSRDHIAGYLMPQTICPWIEATELMQKKIDYRFLQLWMNYCLAECSVGEGIMLTDDDFTQCIAGHQWMTCRTDAWSRIIVGIDWGQLNWVLVLGVNATNDLPYLIGFTVIEDDDRDPLGAVRQVANFIRPFAPECIIADAGYGKDRNAYLLKEFEGIFWACYYNPSDRHSRTFQPQFVPNSSRLIADRTITLKTAVNVLKNKEVGLPVYDSRLKLLIDHFQALALMRVEDEGETYEVIDKTGDDHLAHTFGYCIIGYEMLTKGWKKFDFIM